MDTTTDAALAEEFTLTLTRRLPAPPELVFAAWTEPRHLRRWSAPHGFEVTQSEGELRPGGVWRAAMRAPDGVEHRVVGQYREIEPPRRLVFTHAWLTDGEPGPETVVTVILEPDAAGTLMTFTQTGFGTTGDRDGHEDGWSESFERLAAHLGAPAAA